MPSTLSHLECSECGHRQDPDRLQTVCSQCGSPLLARYDLDVARPAAGHDRELLQERRLEDARDPDGARVVYAAGQEDAFVRELYAVPSAGGAFVKLSGPREEVQGAREGFLALCRSLAPVEGR